MLPVSHAIDYKKKKTDEPTDTKGGANGWVISGDMRSDHWEAHIALVTMAKYKM